MVLLLDFGDVIRIVHVTVIASLVETLALAAEKPLPEPRDQARLRFFQLSLDLLIVENFSAIATACVCRKQRRKLA